MRTDPLQIITFKKKYTGYPNLNSDYRNLFTFFIRRNDPGMKIARV